MSNNTTTSVKDLAAMGPAKLQQLLADSRLQQAKLRMQNSLGALKQPHLIRAARRHTARILHALGIASSTRS